MFSELVVRERQANYVPKNLAGKKTLTLVKEIDLELACEMDFYQYPLDNQVKEYDVRICSFKKRHCYCWISRCASTG